MYTGATGKALFNPEPEDADVEGWSGLIGELSELAEEVSLRAHVSECVNENEARR